MSDTRAPRTLGFRSKSFSSLQEAEAAFNEFGNRMERAYQLLVSDITLIQDVLTGTAAGQMLHWDTVTEKWVYTETGEIFWDDVNKNLGINKSTPTEKLDVGGNIAATVGYFGGITRT